MKMIKGKSISDVIDSTELFDIDIDKGLSYEQVQTRKKQGLINTRKKHVTKSVGKILFDNLLNPLNVLLLVMFVLMIIAKLPFSSFFFIVILSANSILGLIQDFNARRLVSKLSVMTESKTTALRNGEKIEIACDDLVYEDIIFLSSGDQIPADCLIIEGNCSVNESLLTGESLPVNKTYKDDLLSGSYLVSGHVKAKVMKVGSANYVETLEEKASRFARPESEIKKTINFIMIFSVTAVILFGAFTTITYLLNTNKSFYDFVKELSGASVSMIPSGMYLLTSLTLAVGVILLARKRMLVQQLYCIEMLARVDLVCLDKTGTLTDGDMNVEEIISIGDLSQEDIADAVKNLIYCTGDNNATTQALMKHFPKDKDYKISKYIPFNSANKYSAVELLDGSTIAIGAFGFVNAIVDKTTETLIAEKSREGYRVLCLFRNKSGFKNDAMPMLSKLQALILISNSVKPDAPQNIKWFQDNGVGIKIISGDNPLTVSHVAKICGVNNYQKYLDCESVSDEELIEKAAETVIFGRVSPEQKELLIKTFKKHGHTVAMTGDGVNDILALKAADCSVAMANGASAARNVAHMVSLDSDFSKLPNVVEEGRRVINNLQRSCSLFLSKTVFAILISLLVDIMFFVNGFAYPFSTNNMMAWEMISIGFASFFLALQPSKERLHGSFKANIFLKTIPAGIAEVSCAVLAFIFCLFSVPEAFETIAIISYTLLSFIVLAKICLPFDKYRTAVFALCIFALFALFGIDILVSDLSQSSAILDISYLYIDWRNIIAILCITLLSACLYFILDSFIEKKVKSIKEATSL